MENPNEKWQTEVNGQIYESSFAELIQWIAEGSLLPQDMVRRGNLRWIEARKVPALMQFFNAKENGLPPPVVPQIYQSPAAPAAPPAAQTQNYPAPTPDAAAPSFSAPAAFHPPPAFEHGGPAGANPPAAPAFEAAAVGNHFQTPPAAYDPPPNEWPASPGAVAAPPATGACSMHPEAAAVFVCDVCANGFCKACPKSYGGSVKICPFCGAMCRPLEEVRQKQQQAVDYRRAVDEGFGAGDFFAALGYPFRFKSSFVFGAVMFAFFSLGQSASSLGGIFMLSASLICYMLANMLTFGILTNTVENFAQGKIGLNFMPSFDDFSIWDDVLHPFFLSVAVYLVCFGLLIAVFVGTVLYGLNQFSNAISESYSDVNKTKVITDPNSPVRNNPAFDKQKELYGDGEMPDEDALRRAQSPGANEEEEFRKLNDMINEQRRKQLESGIGKVPETRAQERERMMKDFASMAVPLVLLCLASLLWGVFYLPAACCVAGYTRSFVATLNPLVGLETIKLLGFDYVKLWLMGAALVVVGFVAAFVLALLLSPFDLPAMGNVPATFLGAFIGFYLSIVYSVITGFALYKNADKMNLFKG